ncbi:MULTISPECIES: hypothetical protein [unclassified Streptomyces]|nr:MULTISPECIES: hypothetical protein [unclassified Streptomyces]QUC60527.1 hypothetical protein IOD14_29300 [Streptomyces sp. A2-16]
MTRGQALCDAFFFGFGASAAGRRTGPGSHTSAATVPSAPMPAAVHMAVR